MKKRIVSALLVCVLGMSLVTGCGNNAKAAETTKTADGKIQLDLWYSGGKTAVNVFQDIVDAFNESQDKYEVKTTTQADYTETYEKLQAGIAGKKAPDMALLDTDKSRNLSEKNLVADINEYVEKDDSFEKDDYLPVFYEQGEDENGKLFALPAYGTTQVMYYNKAAFEKAGIDPATIKTWQDLAAAAEKMTASDGSFVGWEPMWGSGNLIDAALSNGASLLSEDGKKVMINSDEWVEEAERRGLPNIKSMVDAIPALNTEKAVALFEKFGVFTKAELDSRVEIEYETYAKEINIEAKAMIDIATKQIIPAVIRYTTTLAQSINAVKAACGADISVQTEILMEVSDLLADTKNALSKLEEVTAQGAAMAQGREQAVFYRDEVMTAMKALRTPVDKLEMLVDKSMWPMPSYGDLMFEV